ncbi:MAG TPA: hypothetical protein DCM87_12270, partial [Planctomycetes bacterium]|nr:hypothetical protein [Planctomycetota bacterium]
MVLGLVCEPAEKNEVQVVAVLKGSLADKAGILPGDIVHELGGAKIDSVDALKAAAEALPSKDSVTIVFTRDGKQESREIVIRKPEKKAEP